MQTELSRQLGMDVPVFGFSYEPSVVAAISRNGGFGVLGCLRYGGDADEMDAAISYLERETGGRPFGVNIVMPVSAAAVDASELDDLEAKLRALIPAEHQDFVDAFLAEHDVPPLPEDGEEVRGVLGWTPQTGERQLEVAFAHRPALLASALGPPPKEVVDQAHERDARVAALVGRVDQALKQREQGVDIVVAQGTEAGGHTGEVATMVLVPEVVDALAPAPVLAAGGIGRGRQFAAALALGAQGGWCGSLWLTSTELGLNQRLQQMIAEATSSDTIRSRSLTGKPARQLRTPWIDAWESADNPNPLQMPLQYLLTAEAQARFRAAGREDLLGTPAGQVIGSLQEFRPVADLLHDLVAEAKVTIDRLGTLTRGPAVPA